VLSQVEAAQGRAASAEAALDPLVEVLDVPDFVHVILHHVHVAGLYEHFLAIPHRLEQLLVILLLLDNLLLRVQLLPLLSNLLLHDVIRSQLPQLLLQHQLVVLVSHELLHLLLTALQFDHNLSVTLLDSLAVVALSMPAILEGFLTVLLGLFVLSELLLVED